MRIALLVSSLVATLAPCALAASPCGDCNHDGQVSVLDAQRAAQIAVGLVTSTMPDDLTCAVQGAAGIDILDALEIARYSLGLPASLACGTLRAVHQLGTTAGVPTRTLQSTLDPEGIFVGLNEGTFNEIVTLGAGGNPVLLYELGQTRAVVLEATLVDPLRVVDVTPAVNAEGTTTWTALGPAILLPADGVITAALPNQCDTIEATFTPYGGHTLTTRFQACVDLGGVDRPTRALWLPPGQIDCGLVGLPSGPPVPPVGGTFRQCYYVTGGPAGWIGITFSVNWDPAILPASGYASFDLLHQHAGASIYSHDVFDASLGIHTCTRGILPHIPAGVPPLPLVALQWEVGAPGPIVTNARIETAGEVTGYPYELYPSGAPAASHDPAAPVIPGLSIVSLAGHPCTPPAVCGDLSGDGNADIVDVLGMEMIYLGLTPLGAQAVDAGDVAGHKHPDPRAVLDVVDFMLLMAFVISRIPSLDCCQ
jgi:hypothetical protein